MTAAGAIRQGWDEVWQHLDGAWFNDPAFRAAVLEPIGARIAPETRVLDAGCGEGRYLADLAERGARELVGIDLCAGPLARASRVPGVRVCQAALDHLPFRDRSFDLVSCILALEHVADERAVLSELRRVTAPGGRLLIVVPRTVSPAGFVLHVVSPLSRLLGAGPGVLDRIPIHRTYTDRRLFALATDCGWKVIAERAVVAVTFAAPPALRAIVRAVTRLPGWRRLFADERVLVLARS